MRIIRHLTQLTAALSIAFVCTPRSAKAQQTSVSFDSGSQLLYANSTKTTPLTAGAAATIGDGAVLRLGYYSSATTSSLFAGTFVPLTGQLSANTAYNYTSIGDSPANGAGADGTFALILSFTVGSATTGNNLPTAGTPLAIQFYNNTTIGTATAYNAVSDTLWVWQTPGTPGPTVQISLDQTGLTWFGGASTAFYTSQPTVVPEPSSLVAGALMSVVFGWVMLRRRVRLF